MSDIPEEFERRAFLLAGVGGLAFTALIGRMAQLQIFENKEYRLEAASNQFNYSIIPASRGPIYDRFGIPLAVNRRDFRVLIATDEFPDKNLIDSTLNNVATIIQLDENKLNQARQGIKEAKRHTSTQIAGNLSWEAYSRISLYSANFIGVHPEMGESRNYPMGEAFAHIIGYVAKANDKEIEKDPKAKHPAIRVGRQGIEKTLEDILKGVHGAQKSEVDAHGKVVREIYDPNLVPKAGASVVLTIDAELQQVAHDQLGEESGAIVLIDVNNGDILALASSPSFDNNKFIDGISSADYKALNENERHPLYHKAIRGAYPSGSTIKPMMALAALESGVIKAEDHINCPGFIEIGGNRYHCTARRGHGSLNMVNAIKTSCDVYFYELGRRMGPENMVKTARRFGLGQDHDIGLPGVAKGTFPSPEDKMRIYKKKWEIYDTINMSIGQGLVTVTPLQLAIMVSRIASNGKAIEPNIIKSIDGVEQKRPFENIPISQEHLDIVHRGMYGVTNEAGGTAVANLGIEGVKIAGKTGTAQVRRISMAERATGVKSNASLEWRLRDHSLFICYGPFDNPKYACATIIEHGGFGASAAAPRGREVIKAAILKDPATLPFFVPHNKKTNAATDDGEGGI
ncbi:penicillin-binding protein 2 [Pseudaquidulcibacter saccharophilus]|uniref:penicillin-binding protein 2 n=1 Tax=Pseudaquidulcibacter saccharophilus TaxID=2831900 RepID=UPI001EFF54BC|nr:penicillin-binding protein 2 [Pseudaquidulcibacter saccharophilus]